MTVRKRIGITMGDPAGIGPEVMLKGLAALSRRTDLEPFVPVAYGTESVLAEAARALAIPLKLVGDVDDAVWPSLAFVETARAEAPIPVGTVTAEAGRLAFAAVEKAIADALSGKITAIATCPISKEAINLAGHVYAGHTEILADLTEAAPAPA